MTDTITINGVDYTTVVVTLADLSFDDLMLNEAGGMNNQAILTAAVRRTDGVDIDWATMPVGHAMRLLPAALAACGFEAVARGNV
jgi:hypothetical protein